MNRRHLLFLACLLPAAAGAATVTKENNADALNLGSSWVGGAAPAATDTVLWNATVTGANTVALGAATTWGGLTIANPGGDVVITGANSLTVSGALDTGSTRNLRIGNADAGTLNLGSTVLTGSTILTIQKTADTATSSFNSANALAFNGTLQLRGSTPSTTPAAMQGATGRFWLNAPNGSQAAGTAFALDTGSAANNGQDVILGDWNSSGTRTLTLSSLSGFGSIRTDSGAAATRNLIVNQAVDTTFNGMILSHHSGGGAFRNIAFEKQGAGTLTLAGIVGSQTASSGGSGDTLSVKVSGGTLALAAANTYRGGTLVSAGTVVASNGSALGTAGTVTLNDAATGAAATSLLINSAGGSVTIARPVTVAANGTGTVTLGTSATAGTNQSIFSGAITINRDVTLQGAPAGGDRTQFSGGISGTGNVTVSGSQRVVLLAAANTFTGNVSVNPGSSLQLSDGTATATSLIPDASSVTLGAGSFLRLAKGGNSETINGLSGSGTVDNIVAGAATLVVGGGNATSSFSGNLVNTAGSLSITKAGTGTLTLSGANTYAGTTLLNAGTVVAAGGTAIGDASIVNFNGGSLQLGASETTGLLMGAGGVLDVQSHTLTINQTGSANLLATLAGTGTIVKAGAAQLRPAAAAASGFSGTFRVDDGLLVITGTGTEDGAPNLVINSTDAADGVVLGGNFAGQTATFGNLSGTGGSIGVNFDAATAVRNLQVNQTVAATYAGTLLDATGNRVLGLTKNGAATLTLSTAGSTYSGPTVVNAGILEVSGGNAVGNGSDVTLANASGVALRLLASEAIDGLSGGGATGGNVQLNANTLTIGAGNGTGSYAGVISGAGGVTKSGAGEQTFTTTHAYSGPTVVGGGTLTVATGNEQSLGVNPGAFGAGHLTLNGGTLRVSGASLSVNDPNRGVTVGASGGTFLVDTGLTLSLANPVAAAGGVNAVRKAGEGTFNLTASANYNALFVNDGRMVQQSGVSTVNTSGSGGLTIDPTGVYELAGGTLRTDRVVANGGFVWGAATLTHRDYGTGSHLNPDLSAKFDHSSSGRQAVKSGTTLSFEGDLASSAGSTLVLHGSPTLYLSQNVLFDNLRVTGDLNLSAGGTLATGINPYLLRPFTPDPGAFEAGSLPLVIVAGTLSGQFASVTGITSDGRGFTQDTSPSFPGLAALPVNTWYLEYRSGVSGADLYLPAESGFTGTYDVLFFHYKVASYIPEPTSFGLLAFSGFVLRLLRRRRDLSA